MKTLFRKISIIALCMVLTVSSVCCAYASTDLTTYSDITDIETAVAAATLTGLGVVDGTGGGQFSPNLTLTRAEACKLMITMMGLENKVSSYAKKTVFSDVKAGMWYTGYVNLANAQGIVNGYGNGYFGPEDTITYGQLATMILRMLGYKSTDVGSLWPLDYTNLCEELGISDDLNLNPTEDISRSGAAIMFYRASGAVSKSTNRAYYNSMSAVASTSNGLLYNSSGDVIGFAADNDNYADVKISGTPARVFYNNSGKAVYTFMAQSSSSSSEDSVETGYAVQGYISAASPSVSAATSVTVAGYSFVVTASGRTALSGYKVGSKVTLILDSNLKVTDVKSSSVSCEMIGVLSTDLKSVTLVGSGVKLSASSVTADSSLAGTVVSVSLTGMTSMECTRLGRTSVNKGTLDIANRTYMGKSIAADASIYENAGSGYVYSLEGELGTASTDLSAISWTDSLENVYSTYVHYDANGEIDILVLENVTSNNYKFGQVSVISNGYTESSVTQETYNAAQLVNSSGSAKYMYTVSDASGYLGLALGKNNNGSEKVTKVLELSSFTVYAGEFGSTEQSAAPEIYTRNDIWYILYRGIEYPVDEDVQVYLSRSDKWSSGPDDLTSMISDGYDLEFYYDCEPSEGGQIRIIEIR